MAGVCRAPTTAYLPIANYEHYALGRRGAFNAAFLRESRIAGVAGIGSGKGPTRGCVRIPRTLGLKWTDSCCTFAARKRCFLCRLSSSPHKQIVLSSVVPTSANPTTEIALEIVVIRSSGRVGTAVAERCRFLAA